MWKFIINTPVYLCGDFNCNANISPNHIGSILHRQGLHLLNHEPTFYTDTSSNCLDIFATSEPGRIDSVQTTSPSLSGHSSLILSRKNGLGSGSNYQRHVLNYKKSNWEAINRELSTHNWEEITPNSIWIR